VKQSPSGSIAARRLPDGDERHVSQQWAMATPLPADPMKTHGLPYSAWQSG
jgi:hypothetical protein